MYVTRHKEAINEKVAKDERKQTADRQKTTFDEPCVTSLPSQNKHLHEQIKTVESIGFWHLLHDMGNHRRPVLFPFTDEKLDEFGVAAVEYDCFEVDDAKEYDIVLLVGSISVVQNKNKVAV